MWSKKKKKTILIAVLASVIVGTVSLALTLTFRSKNPPFPASENPENPPTPQPTPPQNNNCPYLIESNLTTPLNKSYSVWLKMILDKEEIAKWRKIPSSFIVNCWNKGYHWHDILQLWEWKIPQTDIPNLKSEKRVGVINSLHVLLGIPTSILYDDSISIEDKKRRHEDGSENGFVRNLIVIIRNKPTGEPSIKIDSKFPQSGPGGDRQNYCRKLINLFCQQEKVNLNQYQICLLECIGAEYLEKEGDIKFGQSHGKSTGTAVYLALLSAWHKKPVSRQIATTGYITTNKKKVKLNNSEIEVGVGTNLPIGGIKEKTIGATKKGVNCLVLSKFQTTPNRLLFWNKKEQRWIGEGYEKEDDYQAAVPVEIKSKIKQVHWTENIQQLKKLLWEDKLS